MFALGLLDVREFYAQLYAHTDVVADPSFAGRGMNAHFGASCAEGVFWETVNAAGGYSAVRGRTR